MYGAFRARQTKAVLRFAAFKGAALSLIDRTGQVAQDKTIESNESLLQSEWQ